MAKQLDKTYDPKSFEERLYAYWEKSGFFKPSDDRTKTPFSVVIPPPNVTGQLHMGHALNNTMQDIIVRAKRMQGFNTLWVPGTDHAGIATQIKVEAELKKNEGLSRHDVGREKFLEKVWAWKELYGNRIVDQLKKLGSSCDWSRLRFTMDDNLSSAVKKTFVSLYEKGLIYRGRRIINFCPRCNTALSDTEVDYKETPGNFWHIRYPFEDGEGALVVATTRPETMLGDTAVAVHPDDERYKALVGKNVILPLVNKPIPVIADEYVDMEFGTGCVKITPCHDPNDFEVGLRHGLEMIEVIDQNARITDDFPKYAGMDRFEARKQIVSDLEACGALVKIEEHSHNVAHCYRCGTIVEPLSSKQWFVKMKPLAEPAIKVVKDGEVRFIPDRFSKNYLNWMENIHDWCISRQLWWGHRIPAFYCGDCGEMTVSEDQLSVCPKCGGKVSQDEDVLDTWFSSALWPFSTLGWPEKTDDLEYFYPTSVLVTAYDIITFWVSKMVFSGLEQMNKIPFPKVFIHGLVRDALGRKMSKSLGNGIDPLEIIDKYGADALRFTLANGNSPGNDMRFSDEKAQASRNFANKIWNAARFILMNLEIEKVTKPRKEDLLPEDKWIVHSVNRLAKDVTENLDKYELGVAVAKLYDFIWDVFCDWYIELVKPRLADKGTESSRTAQNTLAWVFTSALKLLHPFMPFITEEIWQSLPHDGESIMVSEWPQYDEGFEMPAEKQAFDHVIGTIKAIRARRAEMNVPTSKKTRVIILTRDKSDYEGTDAIFSRLAGASSLSFPADHDPDGCSVIAADNAIVHIPVAELIDVEKELARLNDELAKTENEIARVKAKLSNEQFVQRAPEKVVNAEKAKLEGFENTLANLKASIEKLK